MCFYIVRNTTNRYWFYLDSGSFQLEFVIISRVINHLTFYKFECSHWLKLQHSDWRANLVKDFFSNPLKCGFCKKSLRKDEPLTSWTRFWAYLLSLLGGFAVAPSGFSVAPTQKWWQICSKKCSTGQRFIFLKWLFTKSIL